LEFAKANAEIDPSRVHLACFSGGGMAALIMAGRFPDKWAGIVSWGAPSVAQPGKNMLR